jgi:MFS transporter, DHA2 family, multidrug resistance protein
MMLPSRSLPGGSLHLAPVTSAGQALHRFADTHPQLSAESIRPYIGILGGLSVGFDEGAWITTTVGIGQMVAGVVSPYFGAIFGARRVLLVAILMMFTASLLGPFSPNLTAFMAMQALAGLGSGAFIPLTISYIIRNLPGRLLVYGIAFYAMNSELSQNIAASLEGWYTDHWGWGWIDWQYCIMLPLMFACISYGVPKEKVNHGLARELDWPGIIYAAIGFGLLYAGLDQGNRLDWTNGGLVVALLIAGGLVTVAFVTRELFIPRPFLNLPRLLRGNLLLLMLQLVGFRFIILSTAYIIPTYLQTVQNFRELQVGAVLLWIAVPQLVIAVPLAQLLRRCDGRWVLALGAGLIGVACVMASDLTSQWATRDFLPSQILQAIGQSFALTALLALIVRTINPADALAVGCLLQISRLFGGELGTAFMQTFVRVREQVHSNLVGLHVDATTGLTADRLAAYRGALASHSSDLGDVTSRAASLLAKAVAQQASVLAYIDGFMAAAGGAFICLLLVALLQPPPPPRV